MLVMLVRKNMIVIEIPSWIYSLCAEWYGGQACMLYAVCSTGGLTLGTIRPLDCDTDEKWHLHIWREFSADMGYAARIARRGNSEDAELLSIAERWIDSVCSNLEESYGLSDW